MDGKKVNQKSSFSQAFITKARDVLEELAIDGTTALDYGFVKTRHFCFT
jgi:hypothetical protein